MSISLSLVLWLDVFGCFSLSSEGMNESSEIDVCPGKNTSTCN